MFCVSVDRHVEAGFKFFLTPKGIFRALSSCCKFHLLWAWHSISQCEINLPETSLCRGGSAWVVAYCVSLWESCFWSGHKRNYVLLWVSSLSANWLVADPTAGSSVCSTLHNVCISRVFEVWWIVFFFPFCVLKRSQTSPKLNTDAHHTHTQIVTWLGCGLQL